MQNSLKKKNGDSAGINKLKSPSLGDEVFFASDDGGFAGDDGVSMMMTGFRWRRRGFADDDGVSLATAGFR
jgi:hypothetical protein